MPDTVFDDLHDLTYDAGVTQRRADLEDGGTQLRCTQAVDETKIDNAAMRGVRAVEPDMIQGMVASWFGNW